MMEGIFTLPYSEYDVINKMSHLLKKSDGFSFYVPTSRQQKGVDFIIVNHKTNKILKVQVKGSRSYIISDFNNKLAKEYTFGLWFNNFIERYEKGNADIYVLYGLHPKLREKDKVTTKDKAWGSVILCFEEKEMFNLLDKVKTKKESKNDKFFGLAFNTPEKIITERGFLERQDLSEHLLDNYLEKIEKMLQ